MDMAMLALFNAKERSLKDWEDLLNMTDQGLKLVGVTEPKGSALGLLEVQWLPKKPVD
jgi:6-hydroxytryprostatin B O-methyltransferase